jgi:hypothetical protein
VTVSLPAAVLLATTPLSSSTSSEDCSLCHGSPLNAAPPVDVSGSSATSETGVGAHQSHLGTSIWRVEISCSECHLIPAAVGDPGHNDTPLPAELTWGALASSNGATPNWNGVSCSGVYCHGRPFLVVARRRIGPTLVRARRVAERATRCQRVGCIQTVQTLTRT